MATAPKRGQNEGSFSKRKDGLWTARKQFGKKSDGKPNIKAFYGHTKTEVKNKLLEYERQLQSESDKIEPCNTILQDYYLNWLRTYKFNKVKSNTYDALEYCLECRIKPYDIATMQLSQLTKNNLQKYIDELSSSDKKYSFATIKKTYNSLNNCLNYAVKREDLATNPLRDVELPLEDFIETKTKTIEFFDDEDMEKIFVESQRLNGTGSYVYHYGNAVILLMYTGMRIGEGLGLQWKNVDYENNVIHIRNSIVRTLSRNEKMEKVKRDDREISPKTKKGVRTIYLTKRAKLALDNIKKLNGSHTTDDDYLFLSQNYVLSNVKNIRRTLNSIQANANTKVKNSGLHVLRHTFASALIRKHVDVKVISELLGHAKVSTTYDIYAHLIDAQKISALQSLDLV